MQLAVFAALVLACGCGRDAQTTKLLAQIDKIEIPESDYIDGQEVLGGTAEHEAAAKKRISLIGQLYNSSPKDSRVPSLLVQRWHEFPKLMDGVQDARSILASNPPSSVAEAASFFLTQRALQFPTQLGRDRTIDPLDYAQQQFLSKYPTSEFAPELLYAAMQAYQRDTPVDRTKRNQIVRTILGDYPKYDRWFVVKDDFAHQAVMPPVGSVLRLKFKDAARGNEVDTNGKVVILDGWSTYCASCVANMRRVKDLNDAYRDKGLQIVGVGLDDSVTGGLTTLRRFIKESGYDWPQYYEGGYRAFCSKWQIELGTICVFDRQGRLVARNPSQSELEPLIKRLLG